MSGGGEHLKDEGSKIQVVGAGAVAGLVSRFCIAPLDVLKIRLQLQIHSLADPLDVHAVKKKAINTAQVFRNIYVDEGLTAFWKGNIPAELLYVTYGAAQFTTYRLTNQALKPLELSNGAEAFISGGVAGAAAASLTYPLDLLRTRFAAQGTDRVYASLRGGIRDIWQQEGLKGFYHGVGISVGQIVPYMGLFFSIYEVLRPPLADLSLPFGSGDATAGVTASMLAKTGVFPLDLIRKRLQVQGPSRSRYVGGKIPAYGKGVWKIARVIVRREGWRGLYRGLGVGLLKSAPASAITMWTYERVLKIMKESEVLVDA
ncbi:mitochondrial thiamine pyrophosphate transporter [Bacidia gigantensis]|uniref:mitochondrial thiamine pyrophosphate transporter n=1 Tax=Bacidia gigantensis TaxID=2732470 RepID=UPI001D047271|nr:mitochondrial thiamine pyrophosphate transporter [Bacidia gigantensis]KAG8530834.1 mitochondrial thiamine pyrophosphate transporter [Bacidia gigantensis]